MLKNSKYKYENPQKKIVLSGVLKNDITEGTRKLENEFTKLTMAIQIDPKLPIYNKLIELIPRIGTAKFMKALVPEN